MNRRAATLFYGRPMVAPAVESPMLCNKVKTDFCILNSLILQNLHRNQIYLIYFESRQLKFAGFAVIFRSKLHIFKKNACIFIPTVI